MWTCGFERAHCIGDFGLGSETAIIDDKEVSMLNRAALIVRPKQPYLDWAVSVDDSGIVPDGSGERTVYLVPGYEDDEEAKRLLELIYADIFENELCGWHTDEAAWPKKRDLETFLAWFTIELHSVVEDWCADDLVDDESEEPREG